MSERPNIHEQNNLVGAPQYESLMDEFDTTISTHMAATGDDWDMAAGFTPPNFPTHAFPTHAGAKAYLDNERLPSAIEVT